MIKLRRGKRAQTTRIVSFGPLVSDFFLLLIITLLIKYTYVSNHGTYLNTPGLETHLRLGPNKYYLLFLFILIFIAFNYNINI